MKKTRVCMAMLSGMLLAGCVPEKKMNWSPDGRQAAVLADGGLYRCGPDGELSDKLLDGVKCVAWRADSHGLVLGRMREVTQWSEVEPLLGAEEKSRLLAAGEAVYAEWKRSGDPDAARTLVLSTAGLSENQAKLLALCLRQVHPDIILTETPEEPIEVGIVQLGRLDESGLTLGNVIGGASDGFFDLRIAPGDHAVAFTSGTLDEQVTLSIAPFDGHGMFQVASGVSLYPDWSTDGRFLVYAVATGTGGEDDFQLGALARRQVADENGLLKELPDQEEMVGLLMNYLIRVRCLPDGSMVFTAFELKLPSVAGDMPEYMNFFRFDPARQATVERMLPRKIEPYLGKASMLFEPSPDGRMIAFLDAEDRVAVVTVSSGDLKIVPDSDSEDFLPAWRGNGEIYCGCSSKAEEDGETHFYVARCPVVAGELKPVDFSATWPEEVLKELKD